jgi:hypothetical protein
VARTLVVQGSLLILVAIIHLAMTPEIASIVACHTTAAAFKFLWPPYAVDHIVVGVLLFAIGVATMLCASGVAAGDRLARRVAFVNALAVLSLPIAVVMAVPLQILTNAPPFLTATAILILTGVWMLWPPFASRVRAERGRKG